MLIIKLQGGLGNQMFQYALGKHLSIINKTELYLDLTFLLDRAPDSTIIFRDYDLSIFKLKVETLNNFKFIPTNNSFPVKLFNKITSYWKTPSIFRNRVYKNLYIRERQYHFDPSILKAPKDCYLDGYWQTPKYFNAIENNIKEDFQFTNPLPDKFSDLIASITNNQSVCINVRRTDFISNNHNGALKTDYFEKAIKIIEEKIKDPFYFVFSDDVEWCEKNLKDFSKNLTVINHNYAGEKFQYYLHLMSLCKHFIIPNSTFGWWAAWLSNYSDKIVVAPKQWFIKNDRNTADVYPESWIII